MKYLALAITCALFAGCQSENAAPSAAVPEKLSPATAPPAEVALIPRTALFGNPARTGGTISPDGQTLAYLAPSNGVMNVFIAPRSAPDNAKALTKEMTRPIRSFFFAYDNQHLIYVQDAAGDENFHLFATNLATGETRDITPFEGARANLAGTSEQVPGELLVNINDRDKSAFDLYRIEIATGKRKLVQKNDQGFAGFVSNDKFEVMMAVKPRPDGGSDVLRNTAKGWVNYTSIDFEDAGTTSPAGLTADAKTLYMRDSRGRDTSAIAEAAIRLRCLRLIWRLT